MAKDVDPLFKHLLAVSISSSSFFKSLHLNLFCVCVYVCIGTCVYCADTRGHFQETILSIVWVLRTGLGHQAWLQVSLPYLGNKTSLISKNVYIITGKNKTT